MRYDGRLDFLTDRYFFFLLLSLPCDFRFASDMLSDFFIVNRARDAKCKEIVVGLCHNAKKDYIIQGFGNNPVF